MKKVLSFTLVLIMLFSVLALTVHAQESKIGDSLQEKLKTVEPEEKLDITVSFAYPTCPEPNFEQEDYGDDVQSYIHDYRAYKRNYYTENTNTAIQELQTQIEIEVIYASRYTPCADLSIKAGDIEKLSANDLIDSIDLKCVPIREYNSEYERIYASMLGNNIQDYSYKELVYHHDENDVTDWILVEASSGYPTGLISTVIADRVISHPDGTENFKFGYGIFDIKQGRFEDLEDIKDDLDKYPDLYNTLWKQNIGRPIGDADNDMDLTVLDSTKIQRNIACLETIKESTDSYWCGYRDPSKRISDYDGDGEISILDSTSIQRNLAGLD